VERSMPDAIYPQAAAAAVRLTIGRPASRSAQALQQKRTPFVGRDADCHELKDYVDRMF
jgi:hypothetical protein